MTHDLHLLADRALISKVPPSHGAVVGMPDFVHSYKLIAYGHDSLEKPGFLDREFGRVINVHAVGSSVNIGSPNATATTHTSITLLERLREEVQRAPIDPKEKAGLVTALDKLIHHPVVVASLKNLLGLG